MRTFDVIGEVYKLWRKHPKNYFLPVLEYTLVAMLLSFMVALIVTPIILIFQLVSIVGFHISPIIMISLIAVLLIVLFCLKAASIVIGSLLQGGLARTMEGGLKGEPYNFLDVLRQGWDGKWTFIGIMVMNTVFQNAIFFVLVTLMIAIPGSFLLLFLISPIAGLIGLMIATVLFIFFLSIVIAVAAILAPCILMPFVVQAREGTGVFASVRRGYRFYFRNFKQMAGLGGLYLLATMVANYIPVIKSYLICAVLAYMYTCLLYIYPNRPAPRGKGVRKEIKFKFP